MVQEENRQNCVTANGNRVNVNFNSDGFNVNNWNDVANSNIGVAAARNFLLNLDAD